MLLGQCLGPSASVYALIATEGHFLSDKIGLLTQDTTVYNPLNITLRIILAVATTVLSIMTKSPKDEIVEYNLEHDDAVDAERVTVADKLNGSRII